MRRRAPGIGGTSGAAFGVAMLVTGATSAQGASSGATAADYEPASDGRVLLKKTAPPPAPTPAEQPTPPPPPEGKPLEGDFDPSRDHLELAIGILGGLTNYGPVNFAYQEGGGPVNLAEPFDVAPYDGTFALGLRIELRYVASFVRTTLGFDLPFPNFTRDDTTGVFDVNGEPVTIAVQSLKHQTFNIGIGGEYSFGMLTPYVDVLGGFHFVQTRLSADDQFVNYSGTEFGLSGRLGARYALKKSFFLHGSVTGGILGPSRVLGELGLGFSLL
ncbi:MAG: hypothetical protein AAF928_21845 [Myxococcota bacterium]